MRTLAITVFLTLTLTIGHSFSFGQANDQNFQQNILQKGIVDTTVNDKEKRELDRTSLDISG